MTGFDTPNVNIDSKSNEQNMQIMKSWAIGVADQLNYQLSQFETEIAELQKEVASLKEEQG